MCLKVELIFSIEINFLYYNNNMNKLILVDGIQAVGKTTFCKSLNKPVIHGLSYLSYDITTYLNFSRKKRIYDGFNSICKAIIENIDKNVIIDRSILSSLYFAGGYEEQLKILKSKKLYFLYESYKQLFTIYYLYAKPETILKRRVKRYEELKNLPLNKEILYKLDICKKSSINSIKQEKNKFDSVVEITKKKFPLISIKKINLE